MAFSRVLKGSVEFSSDAGWGFHQTRELAVQVFFPEGVHPQAPFVLARMFGPGSSTQELKVVSGQLDNDGRASDLSIRWQNQGICNEVIEKATLDTRAGVLRGAMTVYDYCSLDAIGREVTEDVVLTNTGSEAPTGELVAPTSLVFPREPSVTWLSNVPLNPDSAAVLAVSAGPKMFEQTIQVQESAVGWSTAETLPPNEAPLLSGPGLKDVIGRDVVVHATTTVASATVPLSDLSLATAPPEGSTVGKVLWDPLEQALTVTYGTWDTTPTRALVNLGEASGMSKLSVRLMNQYCAMPTMSPRAALISSTGALVDVPIVCDASAPAAHVPLPGTGPIWLLVDYAVPSYRYRSETTIRDLAFEPSE